MKKGKHAYNSGMRGGEKSPEPGAVAGASAAADGGAAAKKPAAFESGMRGAEKPAEHAQASAADVEHGLQTGTGLEAIAQGEEPKIIDAGDHYQIPKASLVDGGDHYKLAKKK